MDLPIKLTPSNLRPLAYRIFSKKHGLNIKTDGLAVLTDVVSRRFGSDWKGAKLLEFMEEIAKVWKGEDRGIFLDREGLEEVIREIGKVKLKLKAEVAVRSDTLVDLRSLDSGNDALREQSGDAEIDFWHYFKIVNPDLQPNFKFDRHRKQFTLQKPPTLKSSLNNTVEMFNNRYQLILDRLSRHENFQKTTSMSSMNATTKVGNEISLVKNVVGRDGSVFILFGLLSVNSNGDFILEDGTDYIELDLSQADKAEGCFYTAGMFIIAEGIYSASGGKNNKLTDYIGGIFHVSVLGHPPAEKRDVTFENYGNEDFQGHKLSKLWRRRLVNEERRLDNKFIILGSDCFLDDFKILDGLKKLLTELDDSPPLVLVLVGSFSSIPLTSMTHSLTQSYKNNFDSLAQIFSKCENLVRESHVVLIPGKNDPWQSLYSLGNSNIDYLPQRNIPKVFTTRLQRLFKDKLTLGWNPLRIGYLSQEIVILKSELMSKMKRNDISFGNATTEEPEIYVPNQLKQARKLVKTLLDQGNLQPFLRDMKLVDSNYDNVLRIEPLPSLLFLHDLGVGNFDVTYNGCKVVNVGKLSGSGGLNYAEYDPSERRVVFNTC